MLGLAEGGNPIKKLIQYWCVIFVIAMVAFSGCTDKSSDATSDKNSGDTKTTGITSTKSNEMPSNYILINRSATLYNSIGRYTKPDPGKVFLLLNMEIENHGYSEFSVNPLYFPIIIDGVEYSRDSATYALDDLGFAPLDTVKLRNGGKTSGGLVYQIPEGKTQYAIEYDGIGSYNFKYGSLQTKEQTTIPEPEYTIKGLSFTAFRDAFEIDEENKDGTTVYTSQTGVATQVTRVDRTNGFLVVEIKTYLSGEDAPIDKDAAIEDAFEKAEKYIPVYSNRITKKGPYDITLSNGETVDGYTWKAPSGELKDGKAEVCCFMPDNTTIVTVVASMDDKFVDKFFETLKIEGMN